MAASRRQWGLLAVHACVMIGAAAGMGWHADVREREEILLQTQEFLRGQAFLLRDVAGPKLADEDAAGIQDVVADLGRRTGVRYTVARANGIVVADSDEDPHRVDVLTNRPEVLALRWHDEGLVTRRGDLDDALSMYLVLPVRNSDHRVGYARVSRRMSQVEAQVARHRGRCLAALGGIVLLAVVGGALLTVGRASGAAVGVGRERHGAPGGSA